MPTTDPYILLLLAGGLLALASAVWVVVEKYQEDRQNLLDEVEDLRATAEAQQVMLGKMAGLLAEHSDLMATVKKERGMLPPPRRAIEATAITSQLPIVDGKPVIRSAVVGEITMAPTIKTLRERMEEGDPALHWGGNNVLLFAHKP